MNWKKGILVPIFILFFSTCAFKKESEAKENTEIEIYMNSIKPVEWEHKPYKKDGIIYLPLREFGERLGYSISYSAPYAIVTYSKDYSNSKMWISTIEVKCNNYLIPLKYYPEIKNQTLYIPYTFLEQLALLHLPFSVKELQKEEKDGLLITWIEETPNQKKEPVDYNFAIALLKELPQDQNSVISPEGLQSVLSMTANGTAGNTQEQLLNALSISNLNKTNQILSSQIALQKNAPFSSAVYHSANSIWINEQRYLEASFPWKSDFLSIVQNQYDGLADSIVNGNPEKINQRIEKNTNGLIQNTIDQTDFNVILLNTASFSGT